MSSLLSRFLLGTLALSIPGWSATYTVTNPIDTGNTGDLTSLSGAIAQANSNPGSNILFSVPQVTFNFAPNTFLPPITANMTVGDPTTPANILANNNRVFFVFSGTNVTINDLSILFAGTHAASGGTVQGGAGGGGGGGVGAGAGLFVNSGTTVTLSNVSFFNSTAQGGNGGDSENLLIVGADGGGGGGGAFDGGNGGNVVRGLPTGGGGGGGAFPGNPTDTGAGGTGMSSSPGGNGTSGATYVLGTSGSGGGGGGGSNTLGGTGGTGGDSSLGGAGITAGGGGGGGTIGSVASINGGDGGTEGGGGGGSAQTASLMEGSSGGNGGINGGGGGGGGTSSGSSGGSNFGGKGGFGAGGGGGGLSVPTESSTPDGGQGGIGGGGGGGGGGNGGNSLGGQSPYAGGSGGNGGIIGGEPIGGGGGGGAGLGGAIFVHQNGTLIIKDSGGFTDDLARGGNGGAAILGSPGSSGEGHGFDIFLTGASSGSITFNISSDFQIPNPIESNPGGINSFIKTGSATLFLNGDNTYSTSTGTKVQAGTLVINGSVNDSVIVQAGATLAGNATMHDLTSAGTVTPGNSIGIMNTNNFTTTGKYVVEVDSFGNADLVNASGTASLGNTLLDVTALPGDYPTSITYTIVHAGTISGQFNSNIHFHNNSSLPFNSLQVIYGPNDVFLVLKFATLDIGGLTGVAKKIAESFVAIPLRIASDATFVNDLLLQLSLEELQKAFTMMNPAIFSGLTIAQESTGIMVRSAFTRHLDQLHSLECRTIERDTFNFWMDALGQWQDQDSDDHQVGYDAQTGGVVAGLDRLFTPEFCAGLAGAWTYTNVDWDKIAHGHIKSAYGGIYGSWLRDDFYVDMTAYAARNHYHASRHIQFPGLDRHAKNQHSGYEVLVNLSGGYFFHLYDYQIQPLARFDYEFLHQNPYEETNAKSLNFKIHSKNAQLFRSEVGLDILRCFATKRGKLIPELKISYINESQLGDRKYVGRFTESIVTFTLDGWSPDRNMVAPSAAFTYLTSDDTISLSAHYDAEIGSHYWSQEASLHFDMRF